MINIQIGGEALLLADCQAVEALCIAGIHLHRPLSVAKGLLVPGGTKIAISSSSTGGTHIYPLVI